MNLKRNIVWIAAIILSTACSVQKGSLLSPSATDATPGYSGTVSTGARPLSLVVGNWTGTETATHGESGTLSVTFTQLPTPDQNVAATLEWVSAKTLLHYTGTLAGTVDNMVLTATNIPQGETVCGYEAHGTLNEAGTQITGTYTGNGPAPCPSKAGSFVLNGTSFVPPSCPESFSYSGPNPFELNNSGDATELAYVQANVSNTLTGPTKVEPEGTHWTSDGDYAVVLVKSSTKYWLYVNVHVGDVLDSPSTNHNGRLQDISHVSKFNCALDEVR